MGIFKMQEQSLQHCWKKLCWQLRKLKSLTFKLSPFLQQEVKSRGVLSTGNHCKTVLATYNTLSCIISSLKILLIAVGVNYNYIVLVSLLGN
jgi:hypothetical protein